MGHPVQLAGRGDGLPTPALPMATLYLLAATTTTTTTAAAATTVMTAGIVAALPFLQAHYRLKGGSVAEQAAHVCTQLHEQKL